MSDADSLLARLWAATSPPVRDIDFELAVENALARRSLMINAAGFAAAVIAAVGALTALTPRLVPAFGEIVLALDAAGPVIAAVCAACVVGVWLMRADDGLRDED